MMMISAELQREGSEFFAKFWNDLIAFIASKSNALTKTNQV